MARAAVLAIVLVGLALALPPGARAQDTTPPWGVTWGPTGEGVPVDTQIQVVWNETMDWSSVEGAFRYSDGSTVSTAGLWAHSDATNSSSFVPATLLRPGTRYTVTFGTSARDPAGNLLDQNRNGLSGEACSPSPPFPGDCLVWQFTTEGPALDTEAPRVLSTTPAPGGTAPVDVAIEIRFSETMDTPSVEGAFAYGDGFSLYTAADGAVSWTASSAPDDTFRFVPSLWFSSGGSVTVVLGDGGPRDGAGNVLDGDGDGAPGGAHTWAFSVEPDPSPPRVLEAVPADGAAAVSISAGIRIVFSKSMLRTSVEGALRLETPAGPNFTEENGLASWTGDRFPADTLLFNPYGNLRTGTPYTFTINGTVARDREGLSLDGDADGTPTGSPGDDVVVRFTTEIADLTPPGVAAREPAADAAGVPPTTRIVAGFTEPMDLDSLAAAFSYTDGTTSYGEADGIYTWNDAMDSFAFTPARTLGFGARYTVTIDGSARDLAGNPLNGGSNETWSFTTAGQPDTTPPRILWTSPFDGQGNVSRTARVSIIFSEPMDKASVHAAMGITGGAGLSNFRWPNDATVEAAAGPMDYRTPYVVFVLTVARDLAGNDLAQPSQIAFTTEAWRGRVTGRVVDESGAGISGARVQLGSLVVLSNGEGSFAFQSVDQGSYGIEIALEGYATHAATVTVEPEAGDLGTFTLRRPSPGVDAAPWAIAGGVLLFLALLAVFLRRRRGKPAERYETWKPAKVVVVEPGETRGEGP